MKKFVLSIAVALFTIASQPASAFDWMVFNDHPVVAGDCEATAEQLWLQPEHYAYKDKLKFVFLEGEINFAGCYVLKWWSQGSNSNIGFIIDVESGIAYRLPASQLGYRFVIESNLLVVDSLPDNYPGEPESTIRTKEYVWDERAKEWLLVSEKKPEVS